MTESSFTEFDTIDIGRVVSSDFHLYWPGLARTCIGRVSLVKISSVYNWFDGDYFENKLSL